MAEDPGDLYSPIAGAQIDALAGGPDGDFYDAVVDAIDRVLDNTEDARSASPPLRDSIGRPVRATVVMYERDPCWFVIWGEREAGVIILGVGALPRI